jgi:uncharacterized protein
MRRWALLLVVLVGACGDDEPDAAPAVTTTGAVAPSGSSSPSTSSPAVPPTTVDVDGREPDQVEPPPADGVPVTAVPSTGASRTPLPGFGEVVVEVVSWCLLLAETPAQTRRGLMEVTDPDLGGYDGMLFRFDVDREGGFYMRNTPQPLSIVYLDAAGEVVTIERMEPCEDFDGCPSYPADNSYRRTIEVPVDAGGVAALGIEPGAVVTDTGRTCTA